MESNLKLRSNPDEALDIKPGKEDNPDEALAEKRGRMLFSEEQVIHWIKIILLTCAVIYGLIVVGCYFCHLVLPTNHRWLTAEQVLEIKDVAITISAGVVVSLCISLLMPYNGRKK